MAKFKVLKKIAALTTATALVVCFAASASAAQVTTTTTYVNTDEVRVNVNVQAVDDGVDYVTYYAATYNSETEEDDIFYIDQQTVVDGSVNFNFAVDRKYLGSEVYIGFSGSETPLTETIKGKKVTVKGSTTPIAFLPTEEKNPAVTFSYVCEEGKTVDINNVTVESGADAKTTTCYDTANSMLTVVFSNVSGDVVLNIPQMPTSDISVTAEYIDGAGIVVTNPAVKDGVATGENVDDANADKAGDRKLTVVGKVTASAENYGVIVSENSFSGGIYSEETFGATFNDENVVYNALHKLDTGANAGMFAVQLIDTSVEEENPTDVFVKSNATYYVAIYAEDSNIGYVLSEVKAITVE